MKEKVKTQYFFLKEIVQSSNYNATATTKLENGKFGQKFWSESHDGI